MILGLADITGTEKFYFKDKIVEKLVFKKSIFKFQKIAFFLEVFFTSLFVKFSNRFMQFLMELLVLMLNNLLHFRPQYMDNL